MEKFLVELQAETDRKLLERTVLKGDSLEVRSTLSQTRYELLNLRDTDQTQKELLNRMLGRELDTEFSVAPGYRMEIGGEHAKQEARFTNLTQVLIISIFGITQHCCCNLGTR